MARSRGPLVQRSLAERLPTEPAGERTRARYEAGAPGLMIPPAWDWVGIACVP